jgi:hypothetical protein
MDAVERLGLALSEALEAARTQKVDRIEVDWRALDFINSTCVNKFVTWIDHARSGGDGRPLTIAFVIGEQRWQGRTLAALQGLANDSVLVEVVSG